MTKYILFILFIFLSNCSFDTKSGIWTEEKKIEKLAKNVSKILEKKSVRKKEFNSNFKINVRKDFYNKSDELLNNLAIKDFNKDIKNLSKFKFSKIENFDRFEPELVFDGKNFIFFDDKGNLIKFDDNFKIVWKKNYYSKQEKNKSQFSLCPQLKKFLLYLIIFQNFMQLIWTQAI